MPEIFTQKSTSLTSKPAKVTTPKTIILDFDGVVVESNELKTRSFTQVFARFPEYATEMLHFHTDNISLSRYAKFDYLLNLLGRKHDHTLRKNLASDFSEKMTEGMVNVPLVAGALNFLETMAARVPIYLASVTPETELNLILGQQKLAQWFRGVYGYPPWTKPDAIRDVLRREKITAVDAILIGDSAGDQTAARITGVTFLARNSGLTFEEPTPKCFSNMFEVSQYVERMFL